MFKVPSSPAHSMIDSVSYKWEKPQTARHWGCSEIEAPHWGTNKDQRKWSRLLKAWGERLRQLEKRLVKWFSYEHFQVSERKTRRKRRHYHGARLQRGRDLGWGLTVVRVAELHHVCACHGEKGYPRTPNYLPPVSVHIQSYFWSRHLTALRREGYKGYKLHWGLPKPLLPWCMG